MTNAFFRYISTSQGCVGLRVCVGTSFVVRRDRLTEIGERGDLGRHESDLYDVRTLDAYVMQA
jgi:hypothetical protein